MQVFEARDDVSLAALAPSQRQGDLPQFDAVRLKLSQS